MSASNFYTQDDFPLYALMPSEFAVNFCTNCDTYFAHDETACPCCGSTNIEEREDEWEYYDLAHDIMHDLEELNNGLTFFEVKALSGYYEGLQLYVEHLHYDDIKEIDNDDAHYFFDCCRSVCLRKYRSEYNRLLKILKQFAEEHCMIQLAVSARFSNGETWYSKVS